MFNGANSRTSSFQAAKPRSTLKQHICFALDHECSEETTIKDINLETIKY
jgi:hypothetical protein